MSYYLTENNVNETKVALSTKYPVLSDFLKIYFVNTIKYFGIHIKIIIRISLT